MKKLISISLIIIGLILLIISIYPILEMSQEVGNSLSEWEEIKAYYTQQDNEVQREPFTDDLIGVLTILGFNDRIPVRLGTTDSILKKGIGLDEDTIEPGQIGNSVLYGHREKVLWNLKDVKVDDEIIIETLTNHLIFKVNEIKVVDPDDSFIYEPSEESTITLVTCYPFIYMGPTPQRYVVKATLVDQRE